MTTNTTSSNQSIVFILDNVSDFESMAQGLYANNEVHVLSADGDALAQMASFLDGRTGIDAIHLVSHGQAGVLDLGTVSLNSSNLADYSDSLSVIRASLSQDADFLIYGCDVAQGDVGQAFVSALAEATGADIAASNDTTGPASSGSDADLEVQTGTIEAASLDQSNFHSNLDPLAPEFTDGFGLLATLTDTAVTDVFADITGTLTASDADGLPDSLTFSGGNTSAYGNLTVAANGVFTFAPNAAAINAMVGGQTQTLTFAVDVTDGDGSHSSKDLTINLVGANDAPVVANASGNLAIAEIPGGSDLQVTGSMSGSFGVIDIDAPSAQDETGVVFGLPGGGTDDGGGAYAVGQYGMLYLNASNGDYTFFANATQIEALAGGQVVTDVYQVSATDALGTTGLGSFTVTLTGSNDAPAVTLDWASPSMPSLLEASGLGNSLPGTSYANLGVLLSDAEGSAQFDLTALSSDGWVAVQGEPELLLNEGTYGSAQLNLSTGALVYTLSNASTATQQLNVGDQEVENFNVSVIDAQGATSSTVVSFEINGADDAPELHVEKNPQDAFVIDGNGDLQVNYNHNGVVTMTDVDTDVLTYGNVSFGVAGGFTDDGGNSIYTGGFGMLVVNSATGKFDYVGNPQAMNSVAQDTAAYDAFTLTMSNASGLLGTYAYEVAILGPTQSA